MNAPKVDELDYIHFLVAAQRAFTTTEAARVRAGEPNAPAHDAYTRLLKRIPPDTEALWQEVSPFVQRDRGVLVVDDSTLDKPYARKWRWSRAIGRENITAWCKASTWFPCCGLRARNACRAISASIIVPRTG